MAVVEYRKRSVDGGHGTQYVESIDGVVVRQWLVARQGYYTGDGNPELVGKPVSALRGYGFRKCGQAEAERLLEEEWYGSQAS